MIFDEVWRVCLGKYTLKEVSEESKKKQEITKENIQYETVSKMLHVIISPSSNVTQLQEAF
jgi:hypothetical protein